MSSAACLPFCIFLCPSVCMGWNPDPSQVNAKTSTDFLSEKGSVLCFGSGRYNEIHLNCHKTTLHSAFKFLCNSSFNPPMFHWFWKRKSSCLGSPTNKSETHSVFYAVNSEYSYWSCVKELHIPWGPALLIEKFLSCFSIAGRCSGDLAFRNWHVVLPICFQGCLWKGTSAFPLCLFIAIGWMSSNKLLWWAEWIGNGKTCPVLLGQQEVVYTKLAIWFFPPPTAPYNLS